MDENTKIIEQPKKSRKSLYGFIFIVINIIAVIIVGVISFKGESGVRFKDMFGVWIANYPFLIAAFIASFLALFFEGLKYFFTILILTGNKRFLLSMKVAILGKYYDNITPLGSGGQPFQIYYLNKGGVPMGVAGSLPVVGFFFMQMGFLISCLVAFIFNSGVTDNDVLRITAYVGSVFAVIIPICLVLFSLMPKVANAIVHFFVKIGVKIKIIKNKETTLSKIDKTVTDYTTSLKTITSSKSIVVIQLIFSLLYQLSLCSIPYFVVRACGVDASWFDMFSLCIIVYAAISFIPTPGNSGAAEVSFGLLFTMLSKGVVFWAMNLWRFACFYIILIIGIIIVISGTRKNKKTLEEINTSENIK